MTDPITTTTISCMPLGLIVRSVLYFALYIAGSELGHWLSLPGVFATFWPPSGIFLAALLTAETSKWPRLLLLTFTANMMSDAAFHGQSLVVSFGFSTANLLEGLTCASLMRSFVGQTIRFDSLKDVASLSACGLIGSLFGALIGASVVRGAFPSTEFGTSYRMWWVADLLGIILFTPLFLIIRRPWRFFPWRSVIEAVIAFAGSILFTLLIYGPNPQPIGYLAVPILIWIGIRFGIPGICLANLIRSLISVWGTGQDFGPFRSLGEPAEQILFLQAFLSMTSVTLMLLAGEVSERWRSARVLVESETRYRELLESTNDLVHSVDAQGNLLYTNRAWREKLGYTESEITGMNMIQIVHPEDLSLYRYYLHRLIQGEHVECIELRFVTQAGQALVVEGNCKCRYVDGLPTSICSIFRDITSRHEHESQLDLYRRQLEEANFQLQLLATTDGLTGLQNRRAFQGRLEEEVERSQRYGHHVSLLLLDVDHFKSFNDTFGHPAGDEVLKRVSRLLDSTARLSDFVARYGGEEFAIILPNTDAAGAMVFAERVRSVIADEPWETRRITASVGVATLSPDTSVDEAGLDGSSLVQAADEALYYSKHQGRNRTCHAEDLAQVAV